MDLQKAGTAAERSTFVSVVAWIFIAVSGLATFSAIFQNIMLAVVSRTGFFSGLSGTGARGAEHMSPFELFIVHNMRWLFLVVLLISVVMLASAIGLLLRKNWARRMFIVILVGAILWNVGSWCVQYVLFSSVPNTFPEMPPNADAWVETFTTVMLVFSALMALALSALFGWVIKRLKSPTIRSEFS